MGVKFKPRGYEKCPTCEAPVKCFVRINTYDAIACRRCKNWVEKTCSDVECCFCSIRPLDAHHVDWENERNTFYK